MDVPTPVTSSFSILKFIKFSLLAIFIGLLLIEAVYNSAHAHSLSPFITTIGSQLTSCTNELSSASKMVIEQGGYYQRSPDFWTGIWKFFIINMKFFLSFYTLYMWIFVFSWVIARSPFSDKDKTFQNYFFAIIIFFLIQGIFLLAMAGVNKNIDCFSGCEGKGAIDYFISPITSFGDFFNAMDYILKPAFGVVDKVQLLKNGTT